MSVVIELTLRTKPGHYGQVVDIYTAFSSHFQESVHDARTIMITADPASGLIRGIVVYDHADTAESVNSLPLFADFVDSVSPLLIAPPERIELQLLHHFTAGLDGISR